MKKSFLAVWLVAAALMVGAPSPSYATVTYDREEVLLAVDVRVAELADQIAALQATLPGLSGREFGQTNSEIRLLTVRRFQLLSMRRVIPRFSAVRLARVVAYYDLAVSPS